MQRMNGPSPHLGVYPRGGAALPALMLAGDAFHDDGIRIWRIEHVHELIHSPIWGWAQEGGSQWVQGRALTDDLSCWEPYRPIY